MFTGIIETVGVITKVIQQQSNTDFWVQSTIASEIKIDQSIAHNGVCLTVVEIKNDEYRVTAVQETMSKTNLGQLKNGDKINLERSLRIGDRLDGHFVQGHVDTTGKCISMLDNNGSWLYQFSFPTEFGGLIIEKGSICINGVSLTAFNVTNDAFTVTIIPYTYEHTNFLFLQQGNTVNLEFDVLGKYLLRQKEIA